MPAGSNLHVITGSDEGAVAEAAHKLFTQLKPPGDDDFANDIIDGNADNAEHAHNICQSAIQALQTLPFFGGAKIVWLKRATFMGSDRTSEAERAKTGVEHLKDVLEAGIGDDITFILSATAIDKRRAFYKFLKTNAKIIEHNKLDTSRDGWQEQVAILVERKAAEKELQFQADALELFVMMAGEETRQINNELEKLDLYLGRERREITLQDIRTIVPLSRAAVVFEIGRAIQRRDGTRALELIEQQLHRGEAAIGILRASIIPTTRNLFMAATATQGRKLPAHNYNSYNAALNQLPLSELAWLPQKKAGGVNAYPLFLAARDAKAFSLQHLKQCMEACLAADKALVTSALDHRMVLQRLVIQLIGGH